MLGEEYSWKSRQGKGNAGKTEGLPAGSPLRSRAGRYKCGNTFEMSFLPAEPSAGQGTPQPKAGAHHHLQKTWAGYCTQVLQNVEYVKIS